MANIDKTIFITPQFLKDNSELDNNIPDKLLKKPIIIAQEEYILPILGSELYNQLKLEVSGNTLTAENQILMDDYVRLCLSEYALYKAASKILYKYTGKSIEKQKTELTESINLKELALLREEIKTSADILADRLTRFLIANPEDYPLYNQVGDTFDSIPSRQNTAAYNGIYTPKRRTSRYGFDYDDQTNIN